MAPTTRNKGNQLRHQLAIEAARIMLESGTRDFQLAKRKAAQKLDVTNRSQLPDNQEIEAAIMEHQRLFNLDATEQTLQQLRNTAADAMRFFQAYAPCVTGPVLSGSITPHTPVTLHLFVDTPETVHMFLMDNHIPYHTNEKWLRFSKDKQVPIPRIVFIADETEVELILFPENQTQPPLSSVDGKPVKRARLSELLSLLEPE